MTITVNTKAYEKDSSLNANAVRYAGPNQTFSKTDAIDLKRTAPKPTKDFAGVARAQLKLSRTLATGAESSAIGLADVNFSIPVGASDADIDALIADVAGLIQSAAGIAVVKKHDINH